MDTGDLFQTAAGGFFNVPIARNWFYLIGVMPASKKNIVDKLRNKDHVSVLFDTSSAKILAIVNFQFERPCSVASLRLMDFFIVTFYTSFSA